MSHDRIAPAVVGAALLISVVWVSSLGAASVIRARPDAWSEGTRVAAGLVYVTGSYVCHQRADRSFHLAGEPLPVCARCTGLYAGAVVGLFLVFALPRERRSTRAGRTLLLLASLPTVVSVGLEWLGGPSSNWWRAATALPLGAAVALSIAAGLLRRREGGEWSSRPAAARPSATLL